MMQELPLADAAGLSVREAAILFLDGVAAGWDRRALAQWLAGPYRALVVPPPARTRRTSSKPPADTDALDQIDRVMRHARWRVLAALETAALSRGTRPFVARAIALGHVRARRPVDLPGMSLRDRVLSLFAADAIARPSDYEGRMRVCHRCERVLFDDVPSDCRDHAAPILRTISSAPPRR